MRRTLPTAATIAGLLVAATPPALASGAPDVVRPDDGRIAYEGHWSRTADAAVTVNSGSRLRFRFSGTTVHALFDISSVTMPAQIHVSVDGGPKEVHAVDAGDLEIVAHGRGAHTVEISVKDVFSRVNRWTPPLESGVVLTGIRGHLLSQHVLSKRELVFYGDSITQGVMALCEVNTSDCADGTAAYPTLVADALHASLTQVGFGRQGVIQTGNGGVPAASDAYGWNYAGSRADPDRRADVIVVNQGTNDTAFGSAEFQVACRAYLSRLRAAAPHARILALRPFDGSHAADIADVVHELADRRTEFVDTTGWLDAAQGDFNGTVHPSARGHRKVAERLIGLISKKHPQQSPQAKPPSASIPNGVL
ncbi:GDSL-type esterase/lipase family protein [Streptomyces sp. SID13726]|uniref:GDSL-type esterase/lipase family protein n=1 Tax=Streptomyces sp. SID13726 TaxID=2706058 RepID=UPI0013B87BE9|nr:GDSL-type esterase/lipase family protein [Streptomyces sp. SID13726]NEA99397.1 G-D-S-L family lipolytic protein [Streptomyces sp. SID13726]